MRAVLGFMVTLMLAGPCKAATVEVVVPPPVSPAPLPVGVKPRPISLTRIAANIPPGTPWADEALVGGPVPLPCGLDRGVQVSLWKEADNRIESIETWDRVLRQELTLAGFRAGGDPTNLFEQQQTSDLQLGALITDLRLRSCLQSSIAGDTLGGSTVMSVEWQVFSVAEGRVLARISTRGGVVLKQTKGGTALGLITGAFGDNVRRLAADPQFRQLVTSSTSRPPAALAPTSLRLASAEGSVPLATAVKSVVSIFAGDGLGSGVVISPDGYILTNHHVAGADGQVRIRWPDGTDTVGEVVRGDRRRDVALIKATPKAVALPIRRTPVQVGESVFAIGTPLRKEFANTLTRGVVSATRELEGQSMIQSDVAVDHGNSGGPLLDEQGRIVAITVSRYEPDGVSRNINFFIPIDDALKALALTPAP
jgi:S1-C subfamily serine protease